MKTDPEFVVQRQLDAYNSRDIEALMSNYAEDVELYEHPSQLLAAVQSRCENVWQPDSVK